MINCIWRLWKLDIGSSAQTLYYFSIQDVKMGAQTVQHADINLLGSLHQENLQNSYYQRVYHQNRKSQSIFLKETHSIAKRAACLNYPWAEKLSSLLTHSPERLYQHYKNTLRRNSIREVNQLGFLDHQFQVIFIESFQPRVKELVKEVILEKLVGAVEEGKAYLMVRTWLSRVTCIDQQIEKQELSSCVPQNLNEQALFRCLLPLAEKYFAAGALQPSSPLMEQQGYQPIIPLIKKLRRSGCFTEKLEIMTQFTSTLNFQNIRHILKQLVHVWGRPTIFSHIYVAHQLLGAKLEHLWHYLTDSMGQDFSSTVAITF